jgi:hypothetical protein
MTWITDWEYLWNDRLYIVCPIHSLSDGDYAIGAPALLVSGACARQLTEGCFAALESPPFTYRPKDGTEWDM